MVYGCLEKEERISSTQKYTKEWQDMHLIYLVFIYGVIGTMALKMIQIHKSDNTVTQDLRKSSMEMMTKYFLLMEHSEPIITGTNKSSLQEMVMTLFP